MIKAARKKASMRGIHPGAARQAQETPFHFNELNEQINEKISTSKTSK
jgi:hypothetical protein